MKKLNNISYSSKKTIIFQLKVLKILSPDLTSIDTKYVGFHL